MNTVSYWTLVFKRKFTLGNSRKYPYSTTDGFLEFRRQGGFFEPEFRRQGGVLTNVVLTTFIQACSLNRKRKAHKITCLYPLEIPDLKPHDAFEIPIVSTPLAFGIPVQRTPPCLWNSKKPSVVLYGYFLELPNVCM